MNRYIPLTGHDPAASALVIDTHAPLHVLHDAAAYRLRAATQLVESLASHESAHKDPLLMGDYLQVLAAQMRDGCDLLDIMSQRFFAST